MGLKLAEKPEEIPLLFIKAWNERNADGIAALFDKDAEFVNVVGLWWHTREDIRKAHDYGLKVIFNHSGLKIRKTKVKHLSETIAIVHAKMHLSGQTTHAQGSLPGNRNTIFSFVVHHRDRGWVCASAHNTDIVPGAETNLVTPEGAFKHVSYRKQ